MIRAIGLYVHVPFCAAKCKYCSFASSVQSEVVQETYFERLFEEIEQTECNRPIFSIYFGGGTPSVVKPWLICDTLAKIKKKFRVLENSEITLEANSGTVTKESLALYRQAGFNRISFGGQSFENDTLLKLGRIHSVAEIFEALENAKTAGFDNINLDIIIGAAPLDKEVFKSGVLRAKSLGVTHFSVYILSVDKGTRLFDEVECGQTLVLGEEEVTKEYAFVQKFLESVGFRQYEISNFALEGYEGVHNQNYWAAWEYLGFGLGAHAYFNGKRSEKTASLSEYLALPFEKQVVHQEILTPNQKITERIMLGLRTRRGVNLGTLKSMGCDLMAEKSEIIKKLVNQNMVYINGDFLAINPEFFVVSNLIILELI